MNYIGSKRRLIHHIAAFIEKNLKHKPDLVVDAFAGTGIVSQWFKAIGCTVVANDWQRYSQLITEHALCWDDWPTFAHLLPHLTHDYPHNPKLVKGFSYIDEEMRPFSEAVQRVLSYLIYLPGTEGEFFHRYCEGGRDGRLYFSLENGQRIQAIRDQIGQWEQLNLISEAESDWLVALLIESADRIANTASVYGAFLKSVKPIARTPLRFFVQSPIGSEARTPPQVWNLPATDAIFRAKTELVPSLIYADPPYNTRQYAANYHILETLACWDLDHWRASGKTGLRPQADRQSPFCQPKKVAAAFQELVSAAYPFPLLISYNNEGLLSLDDLRAIGRNIYSSSVVEHIPYSRFRSDIPNAKRRIKNHAIEECLLMLC